MVRDIHDTRGSFTVNWSGSSDVAGMPLRPKRTRCCFVPDAKAVTVAPVSQRTSAMLGAVLLTASTCVAGPISRCSRERGHAWPVSCFFLNSDRNLFLGGSEGWCRRTCKPIAFIFAEISRNEKGNKLQWIRPGAVERAKSSMSLCVSFGL